MQFIFGQTFICTTNEVAKKLAYSDNFKVRCVNLEGDIFEPTGTIIGGSNLKQQDSILLKVQDLNYLQEKMKATRKSNARRD